MLPILYWWNVEALAMKLKCLFLTFIQLGGNEIGTPHKRGEYAARLTQI